LVRLLLVPQRMVVHGFSITNLIIGSLLLLATLLVSMPAFSPSGAVDSTGNDTYAARP